MGRSPHRRNATSRVVVDGERKASRSCSGLGASMVHRRYVVLLLTVLASVALASAQQRDAGEMVARIRTEGLQRSRALALYRTLTDDIGARLTGSPAHMQAARWARDRFAEWGLTNPH